MMREKVCIVLNEREALKAKAAERLQQRLNSLGLSSRRIEIVEDFEQVILEARPEILVIDYLLGDFSTGLDILPLTRTLPAAEQPKVIFLTDEPSVGVAVEALRQGASHYLELGHPEAIQNTVQEILSHTREEQGVPRQAMTYESFKELVDPSESAQLAAEKRAPVTLIYGAAGTGRTTCANILSQTFASREVLSRSIDLRHFDCNLIATCGFGERTGSIKLGDNLSLVVEFLEEDPGALFDFMRENYKRIFGSSSSHLILTTKCAQTRDAWAKAVPSQLVELPNLVEQIENIEEYVKHFTSIVRKLHSRKAPALDDSSVKWLAEQQWPYNIKQLRGVVVDSILKTNFSKRPIDEIVQEQYQLSMERAAASTAEIVIERHTAVQLLEINNHNYRRTAARLGLTVQGLHGLLHSSEKELSDE